MKAALIGIAALALPLPALAQATPAAGTMMKTAPLAADHGLADAGKALSILYSSPDGVTGKGTVPVSGALFRRAVPAEGQAAEGRLAPGGMGARHGGDRRRLRAFPQRPLAA